MGICVLGVYFLGPGKMTRVRFVLLVVIVLCKKIESCLVQSTSPRKLFRFRLQAPLCMLVPIKPQQHFLGGIAVALNL